jgi:hypothetical protein
MIQYNNRKATWGATETVSMAQGEGRWKGGRAGRLTPCESGGHPAEDAEEAKGCCRQQRGYAQTDGGGFGRDGGW